MPRCQAGVLARYYPRAPGAAAANPIVGGCAIQMRPSLVTRLGARTSGPRRPYAFRGINAIGNAEGGDAKRGHLPLDSRRAFRRLREPDFSPGRGNLPTLEYLTTPFCSSQSTAPEAVSSQANRKRRT